jgi:hypothetical protein
MFFGCDCLIHCMAETVQLSRLTFDMSGRRRWAKPAGGCPLDGWVMPLGDERAVHCGVAPRSTALRRPIARTHTLLRRDLAADAMLGIVLRDDNPP